jgi:hypothetical protein
MVLTLALQSEHAYVIFVAIAAVIEVTIFGAKVGSLRKKLNVPYPKMTGPDEFDRVKFCDQITHDIRQCEYIIMHWKDCHSFLFCYS